MTKGRRGRDVTTGIGFVLLVVVNGPGLIAEPIKQ